MRTVESEIENADRQPRFLTRWPGGRKRAIKSTAAGERGREKSRTPVGDTLHLSWIPHRPRGWGQLPLSLYGILSSPPPPPSLPLPGALFFVISVVGRE